MFSLSYKILLILLSITTITVSLIIYFIISSGNSSGAGTGAGGAGGDVGADCPKEKLCKNNTTCCSEWGQICNPANGTECIQDDDTCKKCTNSNQCSNGKFCCPFMRLCVYEDTPCPNTWSANCSPRCDDYMDQTTCTCKNPDFPNNWK